MYDSKQKIPLAKYFKHSLFGAGGENRTLVSSLENLHTNRCTTPAGCYIVAD